MALDFNVTKNRTKTQDLFIRTQDLTQNSNVNIMFLAKVFTRHSEPSASMLTFSYFLCTVAFELTLNQQLCISYSNSNFPKHGNSGSCVRVNMVAAPGEEATKDIFAKK